MLRNVQYFVQVHFGVPVSCHSRLPNLYPINKYIHTKRSIHGQPLLIDHIAYIQSMYSIIICKGSLTVRRYMNDGSYYNIAM